MIYLDYSANTPVDARVLERFCAVCRDFPGNPNSAHIAGEAAAREQTRVTEGIAALLGVEPEEVIYTSGASEANNLAIKGIARASRHLGKHIISTPLEHTSVSAPLTALREQGWEIDLVDVGRDGKLDLEQFRSLLREDTVLAAVCAVDSELGVPQPVAALAEILRDHPNCRLHVDATQAVGKLAVDLRGADTFSLGAHKFYGLNGSGLLVKRKGLALEPLIHGGVGASLYRSGTPTLALNAALEAALRLSLDDRAVRAETVRARSARLREALARDPGVRINSPEDAVPHILNLSVQGVKGSAFQTALSARGVCVSVKSACSSDALPSRAVYAVSRDRKNALSSWRISLSHLTTEAEIDEFLRIFDLCRRELLSPSAGGA